MEINTPKNSASGTASQTPVFPNIVGRIRTAPTINKNVLENDIIADVLPSEKAVNIAEEKIPNPINTKLREYMENPYRVIL